MEASFALPILFFSLLIVIFLFECIRYEDCVMWGMVRTAKEASVEAVTLGEEVVKSPLYFPLKMELYGANSLGNLSNVTGTLEEENISIDAEDTIPLPYELPQFLSVKMKHCVKTRTFSGVESRAGKDKGDTIVYVTKTGRVYHREKECTYLRPQISKVLFADIEHLRNMDGGKYYPCEACDLNEKIGTKSVYIALYGDRYHRIKNCRKIDRAIMEMKLSETGSRTPCSKCGVEEEK